MFGLEALWVKGFIGLIGCKVNGVHGLWAFRLWV